MHAWYYYERASWHMHGRAGGTCMHACLVSKGGLGGGPAWHACTMHAEELPWQSPPLYLHVLLLSSLSPSAPLILCSQGRPTGTAMDRRIHTYPATRWAMDMMPIELPMRSSSSPHLIASPAGRSIHPFLSLLYYYNSTIRTLFIIGWWVLRTAERRPWYSILCLSVRRELAEWTCAADWIILVQIMHTSQEEDKLKLDRVC